MAQYVDKSVVVAGIKRRMDENRGKQTLPQYFGMVEEDLNILSFIDTLEVKEVDLDIKQRMEECPYRQIGCTMYNGYILKCKGACSWVVDYPKLKQLKAQKEE